MSIDNLLNRLEKVRRKGPDKWLACCSGHEDKSPSLAIKQTDDGKILLHCFAGCEIEVIVSSIGLTLADLMPPKPQGYNRTRARAPRFSKTEMFDRLLHESIILGLAIRQLMSGKELSQADLASVHKAESIIDELRIEVGR